MRRPRRWVRCGFIGLTGLLLATPAPAQVVTDLHSFGGPNDGRNPAGSLLLSGSTVYGMTSVGPGITSNGTIFRMNADGTGYSTIHFFAGGLNDGDTPNGSLIQSGSFLYGMTQFGGSASARGTVFKIGIDGSNFALIHSFAGGPTDGANPLGSLAISGTTVFGMTSSGGSIPNGNGLYQNGAIFKMNLDGTGYMVLHNFAGFPSDGSFPNGGALAVSGNTVYGTTLQGGSGGGGTIFKMNTDGTGYSTMHNFIGGIADGAGPQGQLIASGSQLCGFTANGGGSSRGTLYSLGTDGSGFTLMHTFQDAPADGALPVGEPTVSGSTLFGTTGSGGTNALGTILGVGTDGSNYDLMYSFSGSPTDGAGPVGQMQQSGPEFYGMTQHGGLYNTGAVYSFTPIPEPSSLLLVALGGGAALLAHFRRHRAKSVS